MNEPLPQPLQSEKRVATDLDGTGRTEKVSRCCKARLDWRGNWPDSYEVCSECGGGSWPRGVSTVFVYHPSEYERSLENRIVELERLVSSLVKGELPDPHDSPEYQAFVESCVPLCHCREDIRPCDGVLAGGLCDGIEEEEEDDRERDDYSEDGYDGYGHEKEAR